MKNFFFLLVTTTLILTSCGSEEGTPEEEKYKHEFDFSDAKEPITIMGLLDNDEVNALSIETLKGLGENSSGDLRSECKHPRTYILEDVMMDVENDTLQVYVMGVAQNGFGVEGSVSKTVYYNYQKLIKGSKPYKAKLKEVEVEFHDAEIDSLLLEIESINLPF
jgi:hypothetical protein